MDFSKSLMHASIIAFPNGIIPQRAENWVPIKGYENLYHVSDLERVKSLLRSDKWGRIRQEVYMTPTVNGDGYFILELYKEGKSKIKLLHRLIAEAFIPNPGNKRCINHIRSIRHDNSLSNIEWATHSENNKHAFDFGFQIKKVGSGHPGSRLNEQKVIEIRSKYSAGMGSLRKLSKEYNVSVGAIQSVIERKTWKHI